MRKRIEEAGRDKLNVVVLFIDDLGVYDSKVNDLPTGEKL